MIIEPRLNERLRMLAPQVSNHKITRVKFKMENASEV